MRRYLPALVVVAVILAAAYIWSSASCAKPSVQLVKTGVVSSQNNPNFAAASLQAQRTLPQFVDRFEHRKSGDQGFSVMGSFRTPTQTEHIWVRLERVKDGVFYGRLAQEPLLMPGKHRGDAVEVPEHDVADWGYSTDGKTVGGFTMRAAEQP